MAAVGVDQKLRTVVADGQAEVIGDGFVHAEPRRPAKGGGQVATLIAMRQLVRSTGVILPLHRMQAHVILLSRSGPEGARC